MRKRGALSVWKAVLLVFASFIGVGAATALTLYLTGNFNEKIVEPENMNISESVVGQGFYNSELGRFEISGDSKLTISTTTQDVTKKKVTLSFENGVAYEKLSDGTITDGNIIIPQTVYLNSAFDIKINQTYNSSIGVDWPVGGVSKIVAKSESNDKIENKTFSVAVDVPVSKIDLTIAGQEVSGDTQEIVIGSTFEIEAVFSPLTSAYLYNDSSNTKNVYLTIVGSGVTYNESTNKFDAVADTGTGYATVTAYAFKTAYEQEKFFKENENPTSDQIINYLRTNWESTKDKAVSNYLNVKVVPVSVDQVDFDLTGKTVSTSVDKNYVITVNSTNGDKSLGVSIKDNSGNSLPSLYGNVGLKITEDLEGVTFEGMNVMVVTNSGITFEKFDKTKSYVSDDSTEYYILPDTRPSNPGNYFWNMSSTEIVEGNVGVNFFYKENGIWKKYFEDDKTFLLSITGNNNETAIGWVYGHEGTIGLSISADGEAGIELANEVNSVEERNTYKLYKFFIFNDNDSSLIDIEEIFNVEEGVEYDTFLNGDPITIDGVAGPYTLYELKDQSTYLQATRSFDGKVKVVAAIIRTKADGTPYPGKNQIVNISRSRDLTVEGILSITQFEGSTFEFAEGIEKAEDGKYYVPSVSKDDFGQDKSLVTFVLNVSSNDPASDAEKVLRAFENGDLNIVCIDENENVNTTQYVYLKNLVKDQYDDGTERDDRFVGEIIVDSALVNDENGVFVGLALQFNDGKETKKFTLERDNLFEGFYVYKQVPVAINSNFEDAGVSPTGVVYINISQSSGREIEWQEIEGDNTVTLTDSEFDELFEFEIVDQKGKVINVGDGLYKFNFVEVDVQGNPITTNNYISISSDGKIDFNTTYGEEVDAYLKVYVEDAAIEEGEELRQYVSIDTIRFKIKSEGVSKVEYDSSETVGGTSTFEESSKLNEITVRKNVNTGDDINLSDLFKVTMSNGDESTNYEIRLDGTFVSSFSSRSKDLLQMINFNNEGYSADKDLSDYLDTEIESVNVKNPFNQNTTIKFNIKGKNTSGDVTLYDITLNLVFLKDIDVSTNFERLMQQSYSGYLAEVPNNSNAISVFADYEYDLDVYLSFTSEKYRWSNLLSIVGSELGGLIDAGGKEGENGTVNLVASGSKVCLKINPVYSLTPLNVTIYYGVQSSYAFSVTIALYINPNIVAVQNSDSEGYVDLFVDLSEIGSTTYKVSNFYTFYKLTDWIADSTVGKLSGLNFNYGTTSQYISIDNSNDGKIIYASSSDVFEYDGKNIEQTIFVVNANDDSRVDFVLSKEGQITVPVAENAVLHLSLGYYANNEIEMIKNLLKVSRNGVDVTEKAIITYNDKPTLLLMQEDQLTTLHSFEIEDVSSDECFNVEANNQKMTIKTLVPFVFFDEEITLILNNSPKVRISLPVVVTKVSDKFVKYSDKYTDENYKDYAVLLGDVELQEENVFEELVAGKTYQILTNDDGLEADKNSVGFHYNKDVAYGVGNLNNPTVSIVDLAQGYKDGVATLQNNENNKENWSIKLADVAESDEEIYIVLKVTYSDITGSVTYDCFYRIKVVANIEKGQTNYPYAEDYEYLDTVSGNVTKTYEYNSAENKYTVDLSQVFDGYTNAAGMERFEIAVPRLATEFVSGKTYYEKASETEELNIVNIFETNKYYYKDSSENVVLATAFDENETYYLDQEATQEIKLVEFEADKYYVIEKNPFESTYSISKIYIDGSEADLDNAYVSCGIDGNILEITVTNNTKKYDVVVEKKYISENGEIINASLYYTFKINQSSNYTFKITKETETGTETETLTANNGVFTYDIDAGKETVTFVPHLYIKSNDTEATVDEFTIVYQENSDLATVVVNKDTHEITFRPKGTIAKEGNITFFAFTDEKMVFKFVVNVNSFYKFEYVTQSVNSGKLYGFAELYKLIDSSNGNADVTENVSISVKDADQKGVKINDDHTIEFAYLLEDEEFDFVGSIEGYTFEFTILATAKNPQISSEINSSEIRYGRKSFDVTIADILDCFDNENSLLESYLTFAGENKVTITPADVSSENTIVRKELQITYQWEELDDRLFTVTYNYIVNPNVAVTANYPKPDGENEAAAEYIKSGSTFKFVETAEFATAARIVVKNIADAIPDGASEVEKLYTIEVVESDNVTIEGLIPTSLDESNIKLSITNTGSNGTVTFRVTVNSVSVEYRMVVISDEVVKVVTFATNYVESTENIYVEDLASFENTKLFDKNRILNMTFSNSVVTGQTYYIRTRNNGVYKIYEVEAKAGQVVNIDLGDACPNLEYLGTFSSVSLANDFTKSGIDGLYEVEPNLKSRVMFRYADGTLMTQLSAKLKKGSVAFSLEGLELNETETLSIYREKDGEEIYVGIYKIKLSIEFDVAENVNEYKEGYTTKIVQANNTDIPLLSMTEFGFTNTRKGTAFTREMLENSKANLDLNLYGTDTLKIEASETDALKQAANEYSKKLGLKPNAAQVEINTAITDNTKNYITVNGVPAQNNADRNVDWNILAQGADNNGNYVMMRLTYSLTVDGKEFKKPFNILFKVEANSVVYFGTSEGNSEEFDNVKYTANRTAPIYVSSKATCNIDESVTAYMYGNTATNQISSFTIEQGEKEKPIKDVTYNETTLTPSVHTITFPELSLGEKHYFYNATNDFGYKIRIFFKLVGETNPTMNLPVSTVKEGEQLAFSLAYTQVVASTLEVAKNNTTETHNYQTFSNSSCLFKDGETIIEYDKGSELVWIQEKTGETGYNVKGISGNHETLKKIVNSETYDDGDYYIKDANNLYVTPTSYDPNATYYYRDNTVYKELRDFTESTFMIGVPIASSSDDVLQPITISVYKKSHDDKYKANKVYCTFADNKFTPLTVTVGNDITTDVASTLYEKYEFHPTYTASSTVSPTVVDGDGNPLKTAVFTNIPAYAFDNTLKYIDVAVINTTTDVDALESSSAMGNWEVTSIELFKDGEKIGDSSSDDTANLSTSKKVSFYKINGAITLGNVEKTGITIPKVNGYYFGTGNTISGVTMKITLSDGSGNTATFTKTVQVEKSAAAFSGFDNDQTKNGVKDGEAVKTNSGVTNLYNDTLEVTIAPKSSVKFTLSGSGEPSDEISLTNNKAYAVTEYVPINANLKAGNNLYSGEITITVKAGNATFKYNGTDVSDNNFQLAKYSSITLNINDISELSGTLSATSHVSRTLYFVYSADYKYYQTMQTFTVKPLYYSATAGTNNRFSANATEKGTGNKKYYVIPFAEWASKVSLNGTSILLNGESAYKFVFEINNSDQGGSGSAFIDENGTIITNEGFIASDQTVTVNVYMKVSGNNGYFNKEEGLLLGQFRISVGGTSSGDPTIRYVDTDFNNVDPQETQYVYAVGSTVSIKDLLDRNEEASTHYHVVKVGSETPIRNNLDSWTFENKGTYEVYIVKTENGIIKTEDESDYGYKKVTFIIYDETTSTEKIVFVDAGEDYDEYPSDFYKITGDDNNIAQAATTESLSGKTGKVTVELVETASHTLCKYTFYIIKENKETKIGKIQTGSFTLANLDKDKTATEFYRVTRTDSGNTSLTQLKTETTVTETKNMEYLALNSDNTYTMWTVKFYIIPNTATTIYRLMDDDTTFASAIGGSGTIYTIADDGSLKELDPNAKPEDSLVMLKTVIVNGTDIQRNTYNFTVYKDVISVEAEVNAYSSNNLLSTLLNDKVLEGLEPSSVSYYLYDSETGAKTQIVTKSFENIPEEGVKETYYTKVGDDYYLVTVTYKQKVNE